MRDAFAHDAVLELADGADERAPGGAVTLALCGSVDHLPPCPLAPHHVGVRADGDRIAVRVLYAVEPDAETEVRRMIDAALGSGTYVGPEGSLHHWTLVSSAPGQVDDDERDHARRLMRS